MNTRDSSKIVGTGQRKPRILFVGSFMSPAVTKVRGGVQFECQSLIDSPISEAVEWTLLDTTMESLPPPPLRRRLLRAVERMGKFGFEILFRPPSCCLIYVSSGASFLEKGTMTWVARLLGVRVVLRPVSGLIIDDYRRSGLFRWFARFVLRSADKVACQGVRWREFFMAVGNIDAARTPLVYNPVDTSKYSDLPPAGTGEADRALLIGWVERNKGIWDLLAAVKKFAHELEGMKFVICGRGAEFDDFMQAITQADLLRFFDMRGWVNMEQKLEALRECEIFLMLSHREGLPNALLEAMAAGRAVVATAVGSVPDMIYQEETGLLCEPQDADDIGTCILRLRRDRALRRQLAVAARQRIVEKLDYQVVWRQWAEILLPGAGPAEKEKS